MVQHVCGTQATQRLRQDRCPFPHGRGRQAGGCYARCEPDTQVAAPVTAHEVAGGGRGCRAAGGGFRQAHSRRQLPVKPAGRLRQSGATACFTVPTPSSRQAWHTRLCPTAPVASGFPNEACYLPSCVLLLETRAYSPGQQLRKGAEPHARRTSAACSRRCSASASSASSSSPARPPAAVCACNSLAARVQRKRHVQARRAEAVRVRHTHR